MYNLKNLVVIAGGAETGDGTIDVSDKGAILKEIESQKTLFSAREKKSKIKTDEEKT